MSTIRQTFDGVTMRRDVRTFCPQCKRKLKRVLTRTYYRNGFHDEAETRAKYDKDLDKEAVKLNRDGVFCSTCVATCF